MNPRSIHVGQVVALSAESVRKALREVSCCERCSAGATVAFETVVDHVLGNAEGVSSYLLGEFPVCPNCHSPIAETSRVFVGPLPADANSYVLNWYEPCLEETDIVLIDDSTLEETQALLARCDRCDEHTEITFEYLLDAVTGCDPSKTEYLLCHAAKCPTCFNEVTEKTFVVPV